MQSTYQTNRLYLHQLTTGDAPFVFKLVNTSEWKAFIGDRNILTIPDALKYIEGLIANPSISYWVVSLKQPVTSIGMVTLIKRPHLPFPDFGFAFLPDYTRQGLAFEASQVVLADLLKSVKYPTISAITKKENGASINLLKKLGFNYEKRIFHEDDELDLYLISQNR